MSEQNNMKKIVGLNNRYGFEDEQFVNFFLLVQAKANEQGKNILYRLWRRQYRIDR